MVKIVWNNFTKLKPSNNYPAQNLGMRETLEGGGMANSWKRNKQGNSMLDERKREKNWFTSIEIFVLYKIYIDPLKGHWREPIQLGVVHFLREIKTSWNFGELV